MSSLSTGIVASTSSDRLYIVGAASEIDTSALVEAAYQQKTAKADRIDVEIDENESKVTAYTTLQELGETMLESLESLKQTYGYSNQGASVYDDITSYLSSSADVDLTSVLGVSVDETAVQGAYTLEVSQLATKMKVTADPVADKTAALGLEGTFTLATENGTATEISVTASMSLDDLVDAINNISSDTNVSASIVKTSDSSYTMVLAGTVTGEALEYASTGGTNDILQSLGAVNASAVFQNITQPAQDAIVYLDGLEVTSSSNTIEDVLEGVDITLYAAMAGEDINLEIDYDYTAVKDAITSLVDSYNDFRAFYDEQMTLDNSTGDVDDSSVLFSDSMLDGMNSQMSSIITSIFGSNDSMTTLREIGIELNDDNYLEIADDDVLNDVLLNNYDELRELFQTSVTSDNNYISLIDNESTLTDFSLTFDITVDGSGDISSVSVGGDSSLFSYNGDLIVGEENTIYAGLTFAYIEDTNASVTLTVKQGLADLLYNAIDAYTNSLGGLLQETINDIQSINTDLSTEAGDIRDNADDFYQSEVERYARMEVEVAAANSLLNTVRALLGIDSDD